MNGYSSKRGTSKVRRVSGLRIAVLVAGLAVGLAACGGGGSGQTGGASGSGGNDTVQVLYAGSLVNLMEHHIGASFTKATGDDYRGYGGGSSQVANEIKGKVRRGDVFISANPTANKSLMGKAGYVSWYATFARSPLVLGYNPKSKFAKQLKTKPWYKVVTEPGFKLGRTDPKLDPKGKLTAQAIQQAAKHQHDPQLKKKILANSKVFPEEDLVGRLQAGQLDAGFFYSIETTDLKTPTISLRPVHLSAVYTVTVLNHAPNTQGGTTFTLFLLGPKGSKILRKGGFKLVRPATVSGDNGSVPKKLRSVVDTG